jgi:Archaeal/vacuolar-type H+-ATPase subunit I
MAVLKMIALTMVGPQNEMEPVAREMVLSGGFQPIPMDFLVDDRSIRSRVTTESDNPYDDLLARMSTVWKAAGEFLPEPEPVPLEPGFHYEKVRGAVLGITSKLETWNKRREVLLDELERLQATRSYVEALEKLDMKPRELAETRFATPYFGRLSRENYTRLEETTQETPLLVTELSRSRENVWALVFTVPGYREGARKILDAVYFKEFPLAEVLDQLPSEEPLQHLERSIAMHEKSINGLENAAQNILKENRAEYEKMYSMLYTMQRVYDLCKGRGEIGGMYVLSGWIPEDTYHAIRDRLERDAPQTSIIAEQVKDIPYAGVRIPTMLRNNRLVRAFQDVVALYSVPSYGEVDPSPFVAVTFILFFGFMFGDVGHGAVLYAAAHFLGKKRILSRSLAYVMKSASISSVVFGFLYGSIMGVEGVIPAVWLSPMHDTGTLFSVAILVGMIMISVGMILNMVVRYREKDFGRLLFDGQGLAGLFVYWGAAAAIYISAMGIAIPFPVDYLWIVIIGLLVLTLFRDFLARTLLHQHVEKEGAAMQVFEVFHNLLNYFTNTVSFIRLGAFAVNHVALSFAVMAISNLLAHRPGGIVFKGVVLILGNILIIGLEGMIVFIQVLRLEYYEFFGKFYHGGGSVFHPVTWKREKSAQKG